MKRFGMKVLARSVILLSMLIGSGASAMDFKMTVDGETNYFDLRLDRIAVGFANNASTSVRDQLLAALPGIGFPAVDRVEEVQQMTVVRLASGATEADVLALLAAVEAIDAVEWAAPILIYDGLEHIPGPRLFVKFGLHVSDDAARSTLDRFGLSVVKTCDEWADNAYYVARAKGTAWTALDICEQLAAESEVEWAEPDFIRQARLTTNDTFYANQWFLNQASDADIDAPEAWTYTTGTTTVSVSICDVGVQIAHPDLNDHILPGYDSETGDSDPSPTGSDGHGTCCAGLASAETNNSLGVAGVGYNCKIRGAKMGHISGGFIITTDAQIVNCINFSRDSSKVMSNSWGGGSSSSAINTALANAQTAGLVILVSSGNSNGVVQYPATQSTVIAVGATNVIDDRCTPTDWGFGQGSCFGAQLDVVAPGNDQYTTDMTGANGYASGDYYSAFGGTSGACPVAAGVCALIRSVDPSLTSAQVQTILQTTADDLVGAAGEDVAGWDQYMGWGRVNANDAVRYVYQAPLNLAATTGQPTVPLTWNAPWRAVIRYNVYRSATGQFGAYDSIGNAVVTNYNDAAVVSGTPYWYKLKAVYTNGQSDYSNAVTATPLITYNPPQNLLAEGGFDAQVPVSWQTPVSGSPIRYDIYRSTTGQAGAYSLQAGVTAPALNWVDPAVTNGSIYWYKAKAVYTGNFESVYSNADSAMPVAPPNTPPALWHHALDDFAPGSGTVTALASDDGSVASVKMFYRAAGAGLFDSLALIATGNPQEYSASLAAFGFGPYEYYVRALDNLGLGSTVPSAAPAEWYTFDVYDLCPAELGYDDGSPEVYNYAPSPGTGMLWAVKFGPVAPPYVLCGARFAAAKTKPDTAHTPVYFAVYLADGVGGLPGTLVQDGITGSIGNDVGGFGAGIQWAQIVIRDDLFSPVQINASEFYVAVGNTAANKFESFAHDQSVPNNHRSFFYSNCDTAWYSEDEINDNARPGNRLIRAQGFSLIAPNVVISRSGNDIRLDWSNVGADSYNIYSATTENGAFTTFEGSSATTTFLDLNAVSSGTMLFYQVRAVAN
ncbi:S8 family serine peptidase [candidate division KSB1 bacterium]|nr:S8 family serine peptidase [candidate division KSB1 bacterium]